MSVIRSSEEYSLKMEFLYERRGQLRQQLEMLRTLEHLGQSGNYTPDSATGRTVHKYKKEIEETEASLNSLEEQLLVWDFVKRGEERILTTSEVFNAAGAMKRPDSPLIKLLYQLSSISERMGKMGVVVGTVFTHPE